MQDMSGETARSCQFFLTWHSGSLPFPFPWSASHVLCWPVWCIPSVPTAPSLHPAHWVGVGASRFQDWSGSEAFGGGLWRLGRAGRCPSASAVFWALLSVCPYYICDAVLVDTRSPCRLLYMFLTQHTDVLGLLVFTIVFQTRDSGPTSSHHLINALCYNVCVPVTRVILMGLVMLECLVFGSHQGAPSMVRLLWDTDTTSQMCSFSVSGPYIQLMDSGDNLQGDSTAVTNR